MNTLSRNLAICCGIVVALQGARTHAAPADAATLEEVVVTAQKRSERLIDVPSAITSVDTTELVDQNLTQLRDYFSRVPNLQILGESTYDISLRGVTTGGGTNPTLAILIDDVQFGATSFLGLGNSRFPDFDPSMLARVEVLRGPQGTLYGASSLGGLIKYVTREPDMAEFSGRVEAGMESVTDGSTGWFVRGSLNVPMITDRLAVSMSAFTRESPPYLDNVRAGNEEEDVNEAHVYGGQASIVFKASDALKLTLNALKQKRDADFSVGQIVLTDASGTPTFVHRFGENNVSLARTSDVGDQELYSGRIEWAIGDMQLTSLTSWNESTGVNRNDLTNVFGFLFGFYGAGPGSSITIDDAATNEKFSQELRLTGTAGRLDWRAGLFYTKEDSEVVQTLNLFDPTGGTVAKMYTGAGPFEYEERAGFADFTYRVDERWSVQLGTRYAKNEQGYQSTQTVDAPIVPVFGPSSATPIFPSSDNATTWALSPSYHFTPDVMAFVRIATGYRPGGPNTVVGNIPATFSNDTVTNYEIGLKGITAGKTFGFDVSMFQIDWEDVQLQNTDSATQFLFYTNGGKARSRGLEATVNWQPLDGFTIDSNATLMDTELTDPLPQLVGADTLLGQPGDRLPGSARFSGNLGLRKDFRLGFSDAFVAANYSYVGTRKAVFVNSAASLIPRFESPSYSTVDANAGLLFAGDWRLNVFVRNLFDEDGVVTADNRNGTSVTTVHFLQPRTIGVSVSKSF